MTMKFSIILLLLISIEATVAATLLSVIGGYTPSDVPNPMFDPVGCGRPDVPKSAVCDPAGLLLNENKDVIEGFINSAVGAQIAVVIIDEMKPEFVGSDDITVASEHFARTLHDTWGVGDKVTNNGILVFLSVNDRSVYISTGTGVQDKLTRRYVDYLIAEMKPDLRNKAYGTALEKTVVQIDMIMAGKSDIAERNQTPFFTVDTIYIMLCILGACMFFGCVANDSMQLTHLKKGQKALDTFMSEITEASTNQKFVSESCPICLETFSAKATSVASAPPVDGVEIEGQRVVEGYTYSSVSTSFEVDTEEQNIRKRVTETTTAVTGTSTRERDNSPLRPMALHCGHVFCHGK